VDGVFDAADDALEDDALGKIVFVNDDDDDGNLQLDDWQVEPTPGEDDLAEVRIDLDLPSSGSGNMGFVVGLSLTGDVSQVRLWKSADRSEELSAAGFYWMAYQTPPVIFVEALGVGFATLTATLLAPGGQVAVQSNGQPARDEINLRLTRMSLDVNNDYDSDDAVDSFWTYLPGYEGTSAVLSSGPFATVTPLAPQRTNVILNGLGTNMNVSLVTASLNSISEHDGYTGNAPDPGDGLIDDRDDVSFSPDEDQIRTDTDTGGAIEATKSYLRMWVRDYAATSNLNVWVRDGNNNRGHIFRDVVRDTDNDELQDGWEESQVAQYQTYYGCVFSVPVLSIFGAGEPTGANEDIDPDGFTPNTDGDGGRNLPAHKTAGDSLTPLQEYRGFILDGGGFDGNGANGHAGGHKRLSPVYKELLLEVDKMTGVLAMPVEADFNGILSNVAKGFSNATTGAGIRLYWVVDNPRVLHQLFQSADEEVAWANVHRNPILSEFVPVMFVDTYHPEPMYGATFDQTGRAVGCFIYLRDIRTAGALAAYHTRVVHTVAHEVTHALMNAREAPGFDAGEHETNPDPADGPLGPLDRTYLMVPGSITSFPGVIRFSDTVLGQIDLNKKAAADFR